MRQTALPAIQDMFADAVQCHKAGHLADAERLYRKILQIDPRHTDSLHLLGVIAHQVGRNDVGVELIAKAIEINGGEAVYHSNLGFALKDLGRLDEAFAAYNVALRIKPDDAETHFNLGNALKDLGRLDMAVASYGTALCIQPDVAEVHYNQGIALYNLGRFDRAVAAFEAVLRINPDCAEAYSNLGVALKDLGRLDDAVAAYSTALSIKPDYAEAHSNLGIVSNILGRPDVAVAAYGAALCIKPDFAEAHSNLGIALSNLGRIDEAVAVFGMALCIKPDYAEARSNLGVVLKNLWRLDDAIAYFDAALRIKPAHAETHNNRGSTLLEQGKLDEAVASYARALSIKPDDADAGLNLAYTHLYRSGIGLNDVLVRARRWNEVHAAHFPWSAHGRPSHPDRLPRIGFVSADFRCHPVGFFVISAIEGLVRIGYPLTCYSNSSKSDGLTDRFVKAATIWRSVVGLSDDALAEQIRADDIDILIDLSGYSAGSRLLAFARKPAPIQVSWVGYPATTGMPAMDYILADRWQIPPGAEEFYAEAVVRFPDSWVVFEPPADAPPNSDLPCLSQEGITFGSFNVLKKITPEVVAAWSRILTLLPTSRLLMKTQALSCPATQRRYADLFALLGIAAERLQFIGLTSPAQHLECIRRADIALDPFPYAGGRTTLEALWMGLPVITLPRETFSSRHTLSFHSTLGLSALVASNADHYIELAVDLAKDTTRLASLRHGLRSRMLASPLCDTDRFSGHLAIALTTMWRRWCEGKQAVSFDVS